MTCVGAELSRSVAEVVRTDPLFDTAAVVGAQTTAHKATPSFDCEWMMVAVLFCVHPVRNLSSTQNSRAAEYLRRARA